MGWDVGGRIVLGGCVVCVCGDVKKALVSIG